MAVPLDLFLTFVQRRPRLLREVLSLARRGGAVRVLGRSVVALGAEEVRDVLGRPGDFLSGMVYAPKLKLGPLALDLDERELRARERGGLELLTRSERFGDLVARHAATVLAGYDQSFDFVSEFVEPVLARALCEFFSISLAPAPPKLTAQSSYLRCAPGQETFVHWLRKLGGSLADVYPAPYGLETITEALAPEFAAFLASQLSGNRDVELLEQQLGPGSGVRCVGGVLLAAAAVFRASTLAFHELVRQQQLNAALDATGPACLDPAAVTLAYISEALRFNPPFPFLARCCPRPTRIGTTNVPAGAEVIVSLLAAMFDPADVNNPDQFSLHRPAQAYVSFGFGVHECVGRRLAETGMVRSFLALFDWMRQGRLEVKAARDIVFDGQAVDSCELRFGPRNEPQRASHHEPSRTDDIGAARPDAA
jgi:cytochrome P450